MLKVLVLLSFVYLKQSTLPLLFDSDPFSGLFRFSFLPCVVPCLRFSTPDEAANKKAAISKFEFLCFNISGRSDGGWRMANGGCCSSGGEWWSLG